MEPAKLTFRFYVKKGKGRISVRGIEGFVFFRDIIINNDDYNFYYNPTEINLDKKGGRVIALIRDLDDPINADPEKPKGISILIYLKNKIRIVFWSGHLEKDPKKPVTAVIDVLKTIDLYNF